MDNRVRTLPPIATAGRKSTAADDAAAAAAVSALPSPFVPDPGGGNAQSSGRGRQQQQQQQGQQAVTSWDRGAPASAKRRRSGTPREGCTMCRLRKVRQETAPFVCACLLASLSAPTVAV